MKQFQTMSMKGGGGWISMYRFFSLLVSRLCFTKHSKLFSHYTILFLETDGDTWIREEEKTRQEKLSFSFLFLSYAACSVLGQQLKFTVMRQGYWRDQERETMLRRRDNSDQAHRLKNSALPEDIHIAVEQSVKELLHLSLASERSASKTWKVYAEKLRDKSSFHTAIAE